MIKLADIFQDNMTLQRCKPVRIWGVTDTAQRISVKLNGKELLTELFIEGEFAFFLPAQDAAENAVLSICGTDTVQLKNVDIGEVWIAGGQSNMEFLLRYDAEGEEQIQNACDDHFRFYDVGEYSYPEEKESTHKDNRGWDKWVPFQPEWAEYFSAVGVYFALQLRKTLKVPVAIVGCNWGGTTASSWTEKSYLAGDPELKVYLEEYAAAVKDLDMDAYVRSHGRALALLESPEMDRAMRKVLKGGVSFGEYIRAIPLLIRIARTPMPMGPRNQNSPGCLYRMMVSQIAGFGCRGVLWYQGESDDVKADIYDRLFSAMIICWREAWQEELPFLFVQLAPYGKSPGTSGDKYPIVRQKQEEVSQTVPGTYMVSIMDAGMEKDIHPKQKRPVGERLALMARGRIYGEDILCMPPEFASAAVCEGAVKLRFHHAGEGLHMQGDRISALQLYINGKECRRYEAAAAGDTVKITSAAITDAARISVSFAWTGFCKVDLYNSAGLPAKPFQWEGQTL